MLNSAEHEICLADKYQMTKYYYYSAELSMKDVLLPRGLFIDLLSFLLRQRFSFLAPVSNLLSLEMYFLYYIFETSYLS